MQAHVDAAYVAVTRVLGKAFTRAELIRLVELQRGKPLKIEETALPIGVTGYCVALHDVDLIRIRVNLDGILANVAFLHELAHLLLGHIANSPISYADFVRCADIQPSAWRTHTGRYEVPQEHDAETLATLLLECIFKEKRSIPQLARELYGEL